jgi:hypothetical protein
VKRLRFTKKYVGAPEHLHLDLRAMSAQPIKLPGEITNAKVHIAVADFWTHSQ